MVLKIDRQQSNTLDAEGRTECVQHHYKQQSINQWNKRLVVKLIRKQMMQQEKTAGYAGGKLVRARAQSFSGCHYCEPPRRIKAAGDWSARLQILTHPFWIAEARSGVCPFSGVIVSVGVLHLCVLYCIYIITKTTERGTTCC